MCWLGFRGGLWAARIWSIRQLLTVLASGHQKVSQLVHRTPQGCGTGSRALVGTAGFPSRGLQTQRPGSACTRAAAELLCRCTRCREGASLALKQPEGREQQAGAQASPVGGAGSGQDPEAVGTVEATVVGASPPLHKGDCDHWASRSSAGDIYCSLRPSHSQKGIAPQSAGLASRGLCLPQQCPGGLPASPANGLHVCRHSGALRLDPKKQVLHFPLALNFTGPGVSPLLCALTFMASAVGQTQEVPLLRSAYMHAVSCRALPCAGQQGRAGCHLSHTHLARQQQVVLTHS